MSNHYELYVSCAKRLGILGKKESGINAYDLAEIIHQMDECWYKMSTPEKEHFGEMLSRDSCKSSRMTPITS